MWLAPTIVSESEDEPVALASIKSWLRVDADGDDDLIGRLIASARDHAERYCGVSFKARTVKVSCDSFCDFSRLPVGPVNSIVSISYVDADGADQTLSSDVYELVTNGIESWLLLQSGQSWPERQAGSFISVTTSVGYEEIPPAVDLALKLYIARAYETRTEDEQPSGMTTVDGLLGNFRRGV